MRQSNTLHGLCDRRVRLLQLSESPLLDAWLGQLLKQSLPSRGEVAGHIHRCYPDAAPAPQPRVPSANSRVKP